MSYKGSVSEFAWLVPTPSRPEVTKVDNPIFHRLHNATAPRLRYWFDAHNRLADGFFAHSLGGAPRAAGPQAVDVLEERQVGVYDIAVLRASDASDLIEWLCQNGYAVRPDVAPVLADYVRRGWVFTAVRINAGHQAGSERRLRDGVLQSLKFEFRAAQPVYPLKVSSLNPGRTEVLLYAMSEHGIEAPPLRTICVVNNLGFLLDYVLDPVSQRPYEVFYVTKLAGSLRPEDMTRDLVLKQAPTDELLPVQDVRPPVLDNLGASSLLLAASAFVWPYPLVIFQLCFLVAVTPFGRRRRLLWGLGGALFLVIAGPLGTAGYVPEFAERIHESTGYWPVGALAIALVAVGGLLLTRRLRGRVAAKPLAERAH